MAKGAPPRDGIGPMAKAVLVKVTAAEHAAIKRRAADSGVTMSELVRALATPRGPRKG